MALGRRWAGDLDALGICPDGNPCSPLPSSAGMYTLIAPNESRRQKMQRGRHTCSARTQSASHLPYNFLTVFLFSDLERFVGSHRGLKKKPLAVLIILEQLFYC